MIEPELGVPYREHECLCGTKWMARVVMSSTTQNISGERPEYCPKCGKKSAVKSHWVNYDRSEIDVDAAIQKVKDIMERARIGQYRK